MMKKTVLLVAVSILLCLVSAAIGQEKGSAVTSEEILQGLQKTRQYKPQVVESDGETVVGGSRGGTRSVAGKRAFEVTRIKQEGGSLVQETVVAPVDGGYGGVNITVLFDVNSSDIRPESYLQLEQVARALRDPSLKDHVVSLNGHTDSDGPREYNLDLSWRRANSVRRYLVKNCGIPHGRMEVFGYGEERPLVKNDSPANKQKNRRVELILE
jgi:outer membrane protein OmpA-like peptidoglycan-associated protein